MDLKRLYEADQAILATPGLPKESADALRRHERHIRGRYELRRFLDIKAKAGIMKAGLYALANPLAIPAIATGIAADKLAAFKARRKPDMAKPATPRYLLPATVAQK